MRQGRTSARSVRSCAVDFDLSDDQEALVAAAGALLDSRATIDGVRKVADEPGHMDRALWAEMAEQGWLAVERAEDSGGLGMGFVEVAVLAEQVGRHLAPVPFAGTVIARHLVEAAESVQAAGLAGLEDAAGLAERLSTGEAIGAVAWTRRPDQVVARQTDSGWVLTGRPDPVVFGPVADVVIVPAQVEGSQIDGLGGRQLFLLEHPPESSKVAQQAMDVTRSLAWLELDASPAALLTEVSTTDGDSSSVSFDSLVDRAAVAVSAEMLGAAQCVLDMTVQYAKDRVQFGRPIGSFQAIKHRCADMLVDVEGMRSAVYYAAWCIAADTPDASSAASAAKIWCSEAASRVMASGLQVHGGIGFTWEHDMHLFVKRSQLDQVSFGESSWHHDRLAVILRRLAEAGLPVM
jgi:alkylation response protein AidB-like acyl-CoA dehydrogenase